MSCFHIRQRVIWIAAFGHATALAIEVQLHVRQLGYFWYLELDLGCVDGRIEGCQRVLQATALQVWATALSFSCRDHEPDGRRMAGFHAVSRRHLQYTKALLRLLQIGLLLGTSAFAGKPFVRHRQDFLIDWQRPFVPSYP